MTFFDTYNNTYRPLCCIHSAHNMESNLDRNENRVEYMTLDLMMTQNMDNILFLFQEPSVYTLGYDCHLMIQ